MKILKPFRLFLLTLSLIKFANIHAQTDWRLNINDDWFRKYGIKGLQVGDTVPDISLGKALNNHTSKTRFSDFRGKLLILDFWNTSCGDCIALFPKMENLQKEFGEKIQVLLVNVSESEEEIKKAETQHKIKIKFPDLPVIVRDDNYSNNENKIRGPSPLYQFLPMRGVPYHVYISPDGTVEHAGPQSITYKQQIQAILDGKKISYSFSGNLVPILSRDRITPLYKLLGNAKNNLVQYGSFITRYAGYINGPVPTKHENLIDSAAGTRRYTYINAGVFYLYSEALFQKRINSDLFKNHLYGPGIWNNAILPQNMDTLSLFPSDNKFDTKFMQLSFCYEQVVRLNMNEEERLAAMEADLNRYFKNEIGLECHLETIKTVVYSLVRTSNRDRLASMTIEKLPAYEYFDPRHIISKNKEKKYWWKGGELATCLTLLINRSLNTVFLEDKKAAKPNLIFNETGWPNNKVVDIMLPHEDNIKSLEDLRKALVTYDLDIIQVEKDIPFIVFKNVK